MQQQRFVDLSEALQDRIVGGDGFALLDEGANNVDAHGHGLRTIQDVSGHNSTMLGKDIRKMLDISSLRIQHRILRS